MTGDDIARLIYLGLLLLFLAGGVFYVRSRFELGQKLQQALIWVVLFGAIIVLYGQRDTLEREFFPREAYQTSDGAIALRKAENGSFVTTVEINGSPTFMIVDTGASDVFLTQDDARRAGLNPEALSYTGSAATANGVVRTAPVTLQTFTLAGRVDRDVTASVNQGDLSVSLLGMSYLNRFDRIEIQGDQLLLYD